MITPAIIAAIAVLAGGLILCYIPRYIFAAYYTVIIVLISATGITALGNPVPLWIVRPFLPERIQIAGYILHERVSIDLLVSSPEMLVTMPWDEKKAAQLYQADQEAKAGHRPLMMDMDAQRGKPGQGKPAKGKPGASGTKDDEDPLFYPAPRDSLPPKQGE